jgi:hypothetical protein
MTTKRSSADALASLTDLNALLAGAKLTRKQLEHWAGRYEAIRQSCLENEQAWMRNPPRRIRSELAPYEESWARQMAAFERLFDEVEGACRCEADFLLVNLSIHGEALDRVAKALLSFLELPVRCKTSRVQPAPAERESEFSPVLRQRLLEAAARRPDPEKPEGE